MTFQKHLIFLFTIFITFVNGQVMPDKNISDENFTDKQVLDKMLVGSYSFWQKIRHENGMYYDGFHKKDKSKERGSIANAGMGLLSLCIGHELGLEPNAEAKAVKTLLTLSGLTRGFKAERNEKGCFIHFFYMDSGKAIGNNFSPIDTDIMLGGALFVKNYFPNNKQIAMLADNLYKSVDHNVFVGNWQKGQIYLNMLENGNPGKGMTTPYNEYMIVAWMAKNHPNHNKDAEKLWNKFYANTDNLKTARYKNLKPVISPSPKRFTSMFTFMFNYMYVHGFSNNPEFLQQMKNAALTDKAWWNDQKLEGKQDYEWGTGAGLNIRGYTADKIYIDKLGNPNYIVSPHILAGFGPVIPNIVREDLIKMYRDDRLLGRFELEPGIEVLWRYSYKQKRWKAKSIQGVDFSTMLFGLSSLPEYLGPEFFNKYNNFFGKKKDEAKGVGINVQEEHIYIDTLYYNKKNKQVSTIDSAKFVTYRIYDNSDKVSGRVLKTRKGKPVFDIHYANIEKKEMHGIAKYYWNNGKLKRTINYSHRKINGEFTLYYKSGKLKRKDYFVIGKFQKGNCYTEMGKDTTYFRYFEPAKYIGGTDEFGHTIDSNLVYPKEARYLLEDEGIVIVKFEIGKDGKVRNPKIHQSVSDVFDKEVLRVVNLLGDFEPKKKEGKPIKSYFYLAINFHPSNWNRAKSSPKTHRQESPVSENSYYQYFGN